MPERIRHSVGMSYPDLIRLRSGAVGASAPDAIAYPRSKAEVESLLGACSRSGVSVIPFGGGTSVVGGVTADRGRREGPLVTLDASALRSVSVDERSLIATLGPGLRGPQAEEALRAHGLTLGHFPQSFERATIGGFTATRSAGQASTGYGRFDALVTSVEMATPVGVFETLETPHSAAGPALREVAVGSEGALGVIVSTSCKVSPRPTTRLYGSWVFEDFQTGADACRRLTQGGCAPAVLRLSDSEETRVALALSSAGDARRRALGSYLSLRGRAEGCLLICCWEGANEDEVRADEARGVRILRRAGGVGLGGAPARSWERGRFDGPYLRDELVNRGVMIDTLETAHTWTGLERTYSGVCRALDEELGGRCVRMCHLSHAYRDGASLYFTFLAPVTPGEEISSWQRVKRTACAAMVASGATVTHHHAVGRDHREWLQPEIGEVGVEALSAIKERLDPTGVMNPGVLLPGP